MLENLKTRFLHMRGPPSHIARATVRHQRTEGEFGPLVVRDDHEQKVPTRLHHTSSLGERLVNSLPIEVIDRIRADDGVESGRFEWKLSDIGSFDARALVHAGGFQVCKQSLLRICTRPEVLSKDLTKRSTATSVACGRDASTMIADLPVPAPISSTRPSPERRKLWVGNSGTALMLNTNRWIRNAVLDHKAQRHNRSIAQADHLRATATSNSKIAPAMIGRWP